MAKSGFKILVSGLSFPEGPVFDFNGDLWFVEIEGGNLSKWDGKKLVRFDVDGTPNGAMVDKQGKIWFCDSARGEIRLFDPVNKSFKMLCSQTEDGRRLKRPNDLIFDPAGNLLFSDHADGREVPTSAICVLPKGSSRAIVVSDNKYFTNGLALMKGGTTLIFAESYGQRLWVAGWDAANLGLNNERLFARFGEGSPGRPDGIAFDEGENLYVAVSKEPKVNIYNKEGKLTGSLACEGGWPTSCAFDPSGRYGLVVTEAELGQITAYPSFGKGLPIFYG